MNVADDRNAVSKLHWLQIMHRNNSNNFSNLRTVPAERLKDIALSRLDWVTKPNSQ